MYQKMAVVTTIAVRTSVLSKNSSSGTKSWIRLRRDLKRAKGRYTASAVKTLYCLMKWILTKSKSKLYYYRQSVHPGVRHPFVTRNQFFPFSLWLLLNNCRFIDVGRPLWREVGSVVFSFCRASPAQPFSDLRPTGLTSIFYCLYFWDSPNLEGEVPFF
jgi:hypothetical protein